MRVDIRFSRKEWEEVGEPFFQNNKDSGVKIHIDDTGNATIIRGTMPEKLHGDLQAELEVYRQAQNTHAS